MPNIHDLPARYLLTEELARLWKISPRTLERWRYEGVGPTPTKIGGRVLYRVTDVEAFENAGRDEEGR